MKKKVLSLLTAGALVTSMAAVAVSSVSAAIDENGRYAPSAAVQSDPGTYRYYFYMPTEWTSTDPAYAQATSQAGVYWWEGTDACGAVDGSNPDSPSWPGYLSQVGDVEGVFYIDCPVDVTTIIWNNYFNGGEDSEAPEFKIAQQTMNIGSEYYDPGESEVIPGGTDNFDNMIYVCDTTIYSVNELSGQKQFGGSWYYYYGDGQYGAYPTLEEAQAADAVFTGNTHIINPDAVEDPTEPTDPASPDQPVDPEQPGDETTPTDPTAPEETTTAPAEDETQPTTVGQPSEDASSTVDQASTSDTPAGGSGNAAVQTGSSSFAGVLLVLLASASGAAYLVRKKLG